MFTNELICGEKHLILFREEDEDEDEGEEEVVTKSKEIKIAFQI